MLGIFRSAGRARPLIRVSPSQCRHRFALLDDHHLFARIHPGDDFPQVGLGIVEIHTRHDLHPV